MVLATLWSEGHNALLYFKTWHQKYVASDLSLMSDIFIFHPCLCQLSSPSVLYRHYESRILLSFKMIGIMTQYIFIDSKCIFFLKLSSRFISNWIKKILESRRLSMTFLSWRYGQFWWMCRQREFKTVYSKLSIEYFREMYASEYRSM